MGTPREESNKAWEILVERKLIWTIHDALWANSLDGMIKMDSSQEKKLYNHTVRIMDDEEYFVGAIEMFH